MTVNGNIPIRRCTLPPGDAGVDTTVKEMIKITHGKYGAKSPKIRALAINIVRTAGVPEKDYYGEAEAIFKWVQRNIRYIKDPVGQETLSHPEETAFNSRAGDCDDLVVLTSALLGSLGIQSYPVVVGTNPQQYTHVYLHAMIPHGKHRMAGQIIPMDPIMKNWSIGREAQQPQVKRKKLYPQYAAGIQGINGMNNQFIPGIGAYAVGPSYLDTEHAQAEKLLASGSAGGTAQVAPQKGSMIDQKNGVVMNTTRSTQPVEGIDGLFGGVTEIQAPDPGVPGAFVTAKEDRYGRVWQNAPQIKDAKKVGSLGPITARGARLETNLLDSQRALDIPTAAGVLQADARSGKRRKIVTIRPEKQQTVKTIEEEAEEIKGLGLHVTQLACLAGCGPCTGVGASYDGDIADDLVDEAALTSWYADLKAAVTQATAKALDKQYAQFKSMTLRRAAKNAHKLANEAKKVAKKAKQVQSAVTQAPDDKVRIAEVHELMSTDNAQSGFGMHLSGLGAPLPSEYQRMAIQTLITNIKAQRKALQNKLVKLRKRLAELKKSAEKATTPVKQQKQRLLYQGQARLEEAGKRTTGFQPYQPKPLPTAQPVRKLPTRRWTGFRGLEGITDNLPMPLLLVGGGLVLFNLLKKR